MADIKSNKKKMANARNYFKEYCDYTGIHGCKFIGEERTMCEKIIWIIVFCISLFTCITVVYEVFKKWQKSPIIVNFASEKVNIYDITFPAVTICPETKVYSDYFNYTLSLKSSLKMNETNFKGDQLKKLQYMSLLCNVNVYYHKIPKIDTIDEGFYEFLKNGAPQFFTKCIWMGSDYPCEEIFQPLYTDEGLCLTFNMLKKSKIFTSETEGVHSPPPSYVDNDAVNWSADFGYTDDAGLNAYPRRAFLSGSTNSLQVNLAINNTDLDYGCTHFQGYKVVLHSPHRYPTLSNHYIRIPLRKSVSAAITPVVLTTSDDVAQYPIHKRKCAFQKDKKLRYFSEYSQMNCRMECLLNLTMELCGCVEYYMPRLKGMPICGTGKYECVKDATAHRTVLVLQQQSKEHRKAYLKQEQFRGHFKQMGHNLSHKQFCYCPDMCNIIEYNVEITESDYDWPRKMATLGIDLAEDEEGLSASQIEIYFKSSTFIPQERNGLFGLFDFLSNVGGLLGLFIGFSLLSMVEFIYFLSLRIICNLKLYHTWYGKPESPQNRSNIATIPMVTGGTFLHRTTSVNA
ncbi:pickpocket protein 28-like [Anthonomus grandis grandis]|uniref:pickpocket protein 28-like n=1 Tax=Anthonomus grandis grandis TaxID=2921223 RepID=UPI0021653642|nr:pickpocket protein 28-like [Anthonomus grandis grandis]